MKRILTLVILVLSVLCVLPTIASCKGEAPWEYPNVEWYSDSPAIELRTEYSGEPSIGYIDVNAERIEVYLWWGPPTYTFSIYVFNSEEEISAGTDELLLRGKVEYDKSTATLIIQQDNLFDGKYDTITLYQREVQQ